MSLSVNDMRRTLKNVPKYRGAPKWLSRVDNMHDGQVLAVYLRLQRQGLLAK